MSLRDDRQSPFEKIVDSVADVFVEAWLAEEDPRIEDYLKRLPVEAAEEGLRELLSFELELRRRMRGEVFGAENYYQRFPQHRELIDAVFVEIETVGPAASVNSTNLVNSAAPVTESPQESPPEHVGRFVIVGVLGKGSFGHVYRARDTQLDRSVAIKGPSPRYWQRLKDQLRARFQAEGVTRVVNEFLEEARRAASLRHPGLVTVYDFHVEDDRPYIVQELIDGPDLAKWSLGRPADVRQVAKMMLEVAEALSYAHQQGFVHRDLKPANVLVDRDDHPHVTDFGLALHESVRFERFGEVSGTLPYMSPEQLRGEAHRLDGRSDLWSWGVMFYELLVGQRPFEGDRAELVQRIETTEPQLLRQLSRSVPAELERICLKCLEKRRGNRFACAASLIDDLRHWLEVSDPRTAKLTERLQSNDQIVPKGLRSFDEHDADFFLELLPGPRDRDGLPESLRFWKTRIEEMDSDNTFGVGLLYGPSGCGKSSLVKAGLLPRLGNHVSCVYVEATPGDTESRLLRSVRKYRPDLDGNLPATFLRLRERGVGSGRKLLIVLDQFEQWLHGDWSERSTELVDALRHCDGSKVQCVVIVRDDFWLAVSRFLSELEVDLVKGHNTAFVDLFDRRHAESVLATFGRSLGRLSGEPDAEQQAFLDKASTALAENGKVVSVRLALLAEMLKGRPWTPETLASVGGVEGVGEAFLDETFCSPAADPKHRLHQAAARAVLGCLLPKSGLDIKGNKRSRGELMEASGYGSHSRAFSELLRALDSELRLITPTDLQEGPDDDSDSPIDSGERYYQLTHDYLVPPLREWLTRHQKETRRGRAELRLAERTALWSARPENRYLPSWWELPGLWWFTRRSGWNEPQRRMMRQAGRFHGVRAVLGLLAATLVASAAVIFLTGQLEETRTRELISNLRNAEVSRVRQIVDQLKSFPDRAVPLLRQELASAGKSSLKLKLSLALVDTDVDQVPYLYEQLLHAEPEQFLVIRDFLADHKTQLFERLWRVLDDPSADANRQLRAAAALGSYDPKNPNWEGRHERLAAQLAAVPVLSLDGWKEAFRPMASDLVKPLTAIHQDKEKDEVTRQLAAVLLADYVDDYSQLASSLGDAGQKQFEVLYPVLRQYGSDAVRALQSLVWEQAEPTWNDGALDPAWEPVPGSLKLTIESALGTLRERFAFCQTMELKQCVKTTDALRRSGYRPLRVRPFAIDDGIQVAAVWTRDSRSWQLAYDLSGQEITTKDQELRRQGLVPIDIAGYVGRDARGQPANRYAAVWVDGAEEGVEIRMYAGVSPDVEKLQYAEPWKKAGFNRLTSSSLVAQDGCEFRSSVWSKHIDQDFATSVDFSGMEADFTGDIYPGLLVTDLTLTRSVDLQDSQRQDKPPCCFAVWNVSPEFESTELHGLSPDEHLVGCRELIAAGYRPAAMSVAVRGGDSGLVTASVWQRPLVPVEVKETLAERKANAATALLRMGFDADVWPLLKHSSDPRTRTYLIHRLSLLGVDPQLIVEQLDHESDDSTRRALILALGEFNRQQLSPGGRERVANRLLELYASDSDAGIHGACAWVLRQWGQQSRLQSRLQKEARRMSGGRFDNARQWYVNGQGQTLVAIAGPVEFVMGSPPEEVGREMGPQGGAEMQHRRRINHSFAIMAYEVTVNQFEKFVPNSHSRQFARDADHPTNQLTWYAAAAYCNWLSEQEGLNQDEWCYLPNSKNEFAEGMRPAPNYLQRRGYRLPTEAEWEYACRAGTVTSRYYGETTELLDRYAWYAEQSLTRWMLPVGSLKPNDLGLFDMQGNALEWCHEIGKQYVIPRSRHPSEDLPDDSEVRDGQSRLLRGGSFGQHADRTRSAARNTASPRDNRTMIGLRAARTLP